MLVSIVNWTPTEFITAITLTFLLCVALSGVIAEVSEYLHRRLVKWWTGEWPR